MILKYEATHKRCRNDVAIVTVPVVDIVESLHSSFRLVVTEQALFLHLLCFLIRRC